ncbi:MAG: flagellar basal body P-ring formation protein FlgA [Gemmatimonadetes bacterium]|nr:flagellar basal body P-ring formation protein FlgA [Gemmatimonadota bacterium]
MTLSTIVRRVLKGLLLGASASLRLWAQAPATRAPLRDASVTPATAAFAPGPVAARDLPRGTVLVATDLRADSVAQAERMAGWEVRRVIHAGEPVKAPAVEPPALVTANSTVTLEATVGGIRVTRTALALGRGALGDRISVRLDHQRIVTATVSGPGTVRFLQGNDR